MAQLGREAAAEEIGAAAEAVLVDAMGEAGTPDGTYIGMIRHNVTTITEALLGENAY